MPKGKIAAKHNPFQAANKVATVTAVVGVEGGNIINVALTFKDSRGQVLAARAAVQAYLSTLTTGADIVATAPSSGIAIGTNGLLIEEIADKKFTLVCNAAGLADVSLTEAGVATFYLVCVMPDGSLVVSGAITFA